VLVFPAAQYEQYGRHTECDHYTFVWRDRQGAAPSYALALGLGSIFNHHSTPNTGWLCDIEGLSIRYSTLRPVEQGEELFICYGSSLWFQDASAGSAEGSQSSDEEQDFQKGLAHITLQD
jgi:SET domain-containing protein